jgi:hypothetical protein
LITIDIIGLPSSGKSTLCGHLVSMFSAPGHERGRPLLALDEAIRLSQHRRDLGLIKNALKWLPASLREPLIGTRHAVDLWHAFTVDHAPLLHLLYEVLARPGLLRSFRDCLSYAFLQQGIELVLCRNELDPDAALLWDEGFMHRGYTLFGYLAPGSVTGCDIERYVRAAPLPEAVIWVRAPLDVVLARLAQRVRDRIGLPVLLEPCPEDRRASQVAHGMACLEQLVSAAERAGVKVFYADGVALLDSTDEAARIAREVQEWLELKIKVQS